MRVMVLGAYGLIGREIALRLRAEGHDVIGFGRSAAKGQRLMPDFDWRGADLATLTTPQSWRPLLDGVEAIVNAAGALQDGARDHLARTQDQAIRALITAAERAGASLYVQISAPGAATDSRTAFLRTKAAADTRLRASTLDWVIFKPGLVLSADAYGGTSLLRMLAAFPLVQPIMLADARIQTVAAKDVAEAVARALQRTAPLRRDYDLLERETHTLADIVAAFRIWLGLPKARMLIRVPNWIGAGLARGADAAGWLGWRAPLRTTALQVLRDDVLGDGDAWTQASGQHFASLAETLAAMPATAQERLYAHAQLAFPVLLLTLAAFWLASGIIGLARIEEAMAVIASSIPHEIARPLVVAGSLADCAIGAAVVVRPFTRAACWASIAACLGYLTAGTLFTPYLWADPLGAFVKIFPAMALALVVAALTGER